MFNTCHVCDSIEGIWLKKKMFDQMGHSLFLKLRMRWLIHPAVSVIEVLQPGGLKGQKMYNYAITFNLEIIPLRGHLYLIAAVYD